MDEKNQTTMSQLTITIEGKEFSGARVRLSTNGMYKEAFILTDSDGKNIGQAILVLGHHALKDGWHYRTEGNRPKFKQVKFITVKKK